MSPNERIESVVHEYSGKLLSYIRSQVNSEEDAEDILQDVFYQLARVETEGEVAIERVSSWLYRVARNAVLNLWRKKGATPFSLIDAEEDLICAEISDTLANSHADSPETQYLRKLVWEELDMALAELPPEQSDVFCLTVFDGIPVKEISAATGIPVATLLSRKHYAVKFLRQRFHDLYIDLIQNQ